MCLGRFQRTLKRYESISCNKQQTKQTDIPTFNLVLTVNVSLLVIFAPNTLISIYTLMSLIFNYLKYYADKQVNCIIKNGRFFKDRLPELNNYKHAIDKFQIYQHCV